jgi:predicted nucleic acid-binding protein
MMNPAPLTAGFSLNPIRIYWLDASVAVKFVVPELKHESARSILGSGAALFMSDFCFHETLTVLKSKWLRKDLTRDQYLRACYGFVSYATAPQISVETTDIRGSFFDQIKPLVERHNLDVSDAVQIASVKTILGAYAGESRPTFATADNGLAAAARAEGLKVWDIMVEPHP